MTDHNRQRKIAVISDLCGFGRSSLSAAIPVISALHLQCCPVPTAVFSNHTGFEVFSKEDTTAQMKRTISDWQKTGLCFSGIATGFLGSQEQIDVVRTFLETFRTEDNTILVDPVMGDYGRLYPGYSEQLAARLGELLPYADILTPNLTEACFLTGRAYRSDYSGEELFDMCAELSDRGPAKVVISGLEDGGQITNYIYERGKQPRTVSRDKIRESRSGTGDIFAAIIIAQTVRGIPFAQCVEDASEFIRRTLITTAEMGLPVTDGLAVEEHLSDLEKLVHE